MEKNKKIIFVLALFFVMVIVTPLYSEKSTMGINSGVTYAIGASAANFEYGGNLDIGFNYHFSPLFYTKFAFDYDYLPINLVDEVLSIFSLGISAGFDFPVLPFMRVKLYGGGGYYLGLILPDNTGSDPFVSGGLETTFILSPSFQIGIGAAYKNYFSTVSQSASSSLYQGLGLYLAGSFNVGKVGAPRVKFKEINSTPIFPIFYSFYEKNPFGKAILENNSTYPINNVKVSILIPQYMDKPRVTAEIAELGPGKSESFPLSALFTSKILDITEGSKVSMELIVEYSYKGKELVEKAVETVDILYRNAMTWDDDRKAASFVTAKDPIVLKFSKNVVSALKNQNKNAVNKKFRYAMGIFEALGSYGMSYVIDPSSSYIELSKDSNALDYLQFPVQTLSYKAGDCDDLSILYTSLLESIGVETAFITIPGHIFTAFALDITKREASKLFTSLDDLIFLDEKTWIPVEITLVQDGFIKAWRVGARQWRESNANGTAKIYKMHESWTVYNPVGSPGDNFNINLTDFGNFVSKYSTEFNRFVQNEIQEKVRYFEGKIKSGKNVKKYRNSLGVLYARYGFLSDAARYFEKSSKEGYVPAMINLANVYFLQEDYTRSLTYYRMARRRKPGSLSVLVGLARINYRLENQSAVKEYFSEIEKKDPDVADRYAFLVSGGSTTSRAASSDDKEVFTWEEE